MIWFGCLVPAKKGGHTPIADCRQVLSNIEPDIVQEFKERKIMYVRNFREKMGLSWQITFQTNDPKKVEEYCSKSNIEIDKFTNDHLRIKQVRPAVVKHPLTDEEIWFNQAHLFHPGSLDPKIVALLNKSYSNLDMPRNAFYGDGGTIELNTLQHILNAYKKNEISYPWKAGDFLILDNIITAHSRTSFEGQRQIVVAFAKLFESC